VGYGAPCAHLAAPVRPRLARGGRAHTWSSRPRGRGARSISTAWAISPAAASSSWPPARPGRAALGRRALAEPLADLVARAPVARYWTSAAGRRPSAWPATRRGLGASDHDHRLKLVKCLLCAQGCVIADGSRAAAARAERGGSSGASSTAAMAIHVDPIEKKPFFHFLPGAQASRCHSGCPLRCQFSRIPPVAGRARGLRLAFTGPDRIAASAGTGARRSSPSHTTEATVFTEYLTDIAREGRKRGCAASSCRALHERGAARRDVRLLAAVKIDLKGFSEQFYRECRRGAGAGARSIKQVARRKVHLEW